MSGRERRLIVCLGVNTIFLWITIRRMFSDVRPFDWLMLVIELLVLLLIAYEVIPGFWHKRRVKRRLKALSTLVSEGQLLEDSAPSQSDDQTVVVKWTNDVTTWDRKTNETLVCFSKQAAASS